jgi:histidyl-tRNA synthetase
MMEAQKEAEKTIDEMELLFKYLGAMQLLDNVSFDFSLARGLDYYTGLIYEAVLTDDGRVGSISGGGRYDGLIGMFSGKSIPSVGGSIGIERIFNILEEKELAKGVIRATETQILVSQMGKNLAVPRMEVLGKLWKAGVKAETLYVENPKTEKSFDYCFNNGIPLLLLVADQELKDGNYLVKELNTNTQHIVPVDQVVEFVKDLAQKNPVLLPKQDIKGGKDEEVKNSEKQEQYEKVL